MPCIQVFSVNHLVDLRCFVDRFPFLHYHYMVKIAKKDATTLIIKGYTYGNNEVKKCGFTKVIIQRKKSSENSWSNYKTYNDLFSESNSYTLNKSVAVEKGYQYRAKATH